VAQGAAGRPRGGARMSAPLQLSVIVPAYNAMASIRQALEAAASSDLARERFELILVDDGSTDETSLVGAEYCDRVIRLSGRPHGPAYARNRAAELARGEVLVFVDADVIVHRDALSRIVARFASDPDLASVFGSYDDTPSDPGFVSQYRNLLHHYVHQLGHGNAETFWAGLGAIRRRVFLEAGMFDEWHYGRPEIEDIELGRRLRRKGYRILLDPAIQGTHLKRWTFRNTLTSDFRHRGVPWMWLMLMEGGPGNAQTLNVRRREKVLVALTALGMVTPVAAVVLRAWWPLGVAAGVAAGILVSNFGFYRFLLKARGPLFATGVLPLHLLYYGGNAVSVITGWFVHVLFGEPIPPAAVTAHAQIGIATWPPPPRRSEHSIWDSGPHEEES